MGVQLSVLRKQNVTLMYQNISFDLHLFAAFRELLLFLPKQDFIAVIT